MSEADTGEAGGSRPETVWVAAAKLLRPQGRRGELLVELHTDFSFLAPGQTLWLSDNEHKEPADGPQTLEGLWRPTGKNAGRAVVKLAGINSISEAEALAGRFLLLRAADLPALEPDTYRVGDLLGCALYDGPLPMGTVVDLQFPLAPDGHTRLNDAPDLLAVQPSVASSVASSSEAEGEPVLVPFVRAWLVEVDLAAKRIVMQLPPGLFDPEISGTLDEG